MLFAGAAAATPAGTVVAVSGSCTDRGRVLKLGGTVQISDTVDVPEDGNLKLQMADGSVISVAPGSSMTVASYNYGGSGRHVRLSLTQGLLRAHVTPVTGPSTFEVSTAVGTGSVGSDSAPTLPLSRGARARARETAGNQRPWPADKVERWSIDRLIPYAKNARTTRMPRFGVS